MGGGKISPAIQGKDSGEKIHQGQGLKENYPVHPHRVTRLMKGESSYQPSRNRGKVLPKKKISGKPSATEKQHFPITRKGARLNAVKTGKI